MASFVFYRSTVTEILLHYFFGADPTTQLVDQASFFCSGGEATLSECRQSIHSSSCSHFYDAGIIVKSSRDTDQVMISS